LYFVILGISQLTVDHKPENKNEKHRIKSNGGKVYRSRSKKKNSDRSLSNSREVSLGPYRVFPGRLSVSRSIGDYNAKATEKGGNNEVLIAVPDIHKIKIEPNLNFLIIGSDGLFDNQTNTNIIDHVFKLSRQKLAKDNFHKFIGKAATSIIENAVNEYKSTDNIS
jgi:protein phosphatase 2C family protein 2/3